MFESCFLLLLFFSSLFVLLINIIFNNCCLKCYFYARLSYFNFHTIKKTYRCDFIFVGSWQGQKERINFAIQYSMITHIFFIRKKGELINYCWQRSHPFIAFHIDIVSLALSELLSFTLFGAPCHYVRFCYPPIEFVSAAIDLRVSIFEFRT